MTTSFLAELVSQQTELTVALQRATVQITGQGRGIGSGVIWSEGLIITNAHVVTGSEAVVQLADGRSLASTVTARNRSRDLVALEVNPTDLPAATIGDSDTLRVGELVLAVGNPFGLTGTLTTGIVHAIGAARQWIQADVALAPGNSGGPLANAHGQVIGINTLIMDGRGFAIPSRAVQRFLHTCGDRPYLGVTLQPVRVRLHRRPRFGLLITEIAADSPAEAAHLQRGDRLIGIRGQLFQTADELVQVLENSQVGDGLALELLRDDRRITIDVVLWNRNLTNAA